MPKVTINEIDSSRYVAPSENVPMTVLVPGTASFGPTFNSENPKTSVFNGESDLPNFFNLYGFSPAIDDNTGDTLSGDLSYEYATNLLRSGAQVLYYRLNEGEQATSDSQTSEYAIAAKYGGRFGNTLAISITAESNTDTSCVMGIYSFPTEFSTAKENITPEMLLNKNVTRLYYSRISVDPNNKYYIGTNTNDFIVTNAKSISYLISSTTESQHTVIKNLAGGLDFTGEEVKTGDHNKVDVSAITKALINSYSSFSDPYLFEFDFITNGGLIGLTDASAQGNEPITLAESELTLAKTRGDCFALIDFPLHSMTPDEMVQIASDSKLNSSYGAVYAPWCSFVSATTSKTQMMPPSIIFLKSRLLGMQSRTQSELWYVPAGVSRTSAPFIVDTEFEIGSTILDEFQNNHDVRINPIMKLRNYGYCVYGNSTLMQSVPGLPHSSLESVNVRLISNIIKKEIFNVCSGLSFEYNNSDLWLKFYSQMDEKLLYMKRNYGLYDYRIEMGLSTVTTANLNERRIPGKVIISPTLAGEYFDIDFEIMPSGVSFAGEEQ